MTARITLLDRPGADSAGTAEYLLRHGLLTETWQAPEALLGQLAADPPGAVLLHRRLQNSSDLGLLRRVRAVTQAPVLLRAIDADDEVDRVLALEIGADDYLPSTVSLRELLARLRAALRRAAPPPAPAAEMPSGWRLCLKARELFAPDGSARDLTSAEFELLQILVRQVSLPVHRDALSLQVLRRPYQPEDRALDNLVLRLRRKLGDDGANARLIKSVRGIGYVFTGFAAAEAPRAAAPRNLPSGHAVAPQFWPAPLAVGASHGMS